MDDMSIGVKVEHALGRTVMVSFPHGYITGQLEKRHDKVYQVQTINSLVVFALNEVQYVADIGLTVVRLEFTVK